MADFKIGKTSTVGGASSARKTKKSSGSASAFSDSLKEAAGSEAASVATSVSDVTSVGSILSVQEVPDSTEERSKGLLINYGDDILDRLEDIRIGLLLGSISKDRLADLAQHMRQKRQEVDDPELNEIINEIELRSEVEIAKLTRKL